MGTVPSKPLEKVQYYENHIAPFTTNATQIGLVTGDVTDLQARVTAARTAYEAHQAAMQTSKNATAAFNDAVAVLGVVGAALIKKIRAKAEQTGNRNVYTLAEIPAPATPSATPPPGKPTDLTVELDGNGAVILKFKCHNPAGSAGTMYQVYRSVGDGPFQYVGGAGEKKFTDSTVPSGATKLTYQIQAVRSTAVGQWATFVVLFGTNAGGTTTASVKEAAGTPKLAA